MKRHITDTTAANKVTQTEMSNIRIQHKNN